MLRLDEKAATVEVLQVALPLRFFEGVPKVDLDLGDLLEVVWDLEALHIYKCRYERRARGEEDDNTGIAIPCTILASLWYLLKLSNFLSGDFGEVRCEGLPSRQKVMSVKYRPMPDARFSTELAPAAWHRTHRGMVRQAAQYFAAATGTRGNSARGQQAFEAPRAESCSSGIDPRCGVKLSIQLDA